MFNTKPVFGFGKGDVDSSIENREMRINIGGDFSINLAPEVREVIKQGLDAGIAKMVIDLNEVKYIDSSGIGTLVMALKGVERIGAQLEVLGVPEQARKLLKFPPFCKDSEFISGFSAE